MNFVLIFGPAACGKMTVGQALAKITGLKLFHNHMSIELVHQFFDFGTPAFSRLDQSIRFQIFREVAQSNLPGLIFTLVWAMDLEEDKLYVDEILDIFNEVGAKIHFVELVASLEERLKRNKHPHRLHHKPTKRDTERAERALLYDEENYRTNTWNGEFPEYDIFRIDNTNRSAEESAMLIKDHFGLKFNKPMDQ